MGGFSLQITKFSNKNDHVCPWRDFNSTSCVLSRYPKRPVRKDNSSIFNFEYVNEAWISGVLGVKDVWILYLVNLTTGSQMTFATSDQPFELRPLYNRVEAWKSGFCTWWSLLFWTWLLLSKVTEIMSMYVNKSTSFAFISLSKNGYPKRSQK